MNPNFSLDRAAELDRMKREIDLVAFAESEYRYERVKRFDDRTRTCLFSSSGEKLFFKRMKRGERGTTGHWVFCDSYGSQRGTIVDLVQKEEPALSLGEVRKKLRYRLGALERTTPLFPAATGSDPSEPSRSRRVFRFLPLKDHSYLNSRGITSATIEHPYFKGAMGIRYHGPHLNTVFPMYDRGDKIVGLEAKGRGPTGKPYKASVLGSQKAYGLWHSHLPDKKPGTEIVLTESPVDAMSYFQLEARHFEKHAALFIATNGPPTLEHRRIIEKLARDAASPRYVLAFDNDAAGDRYALNFLGARAECNRGRLRYEVGVMAEYADNRRNKKLILTLQADDPVILGRIKKELGRVGNEKLTSNFDEQFRLVGDKAGLRYEAYNFRRNTRSLYDTLSPYSCLNVKRVLAKGKDFNEDLARGKNRTLSPER